MSFWRRSLGLAAVLLVQNVITRALGIVSSGLLARLLTPTDWGSLQAVMQVSATMVQTLKLSVDGALQIRLAETGRPDGPSSGDILGAALLLIAAVSALAVLLGTYLSGLSASLFGEPSLAPYMGWAGWMTVGQLIAQVAAVLLALGQFRTLAAVQVFCNALYLGLLAAAHVVGGRTLWVGLAAQLFLQLGTGLVVLVYAARAWRARAVRPALGHWRAAQRELLGIGLPLHAAAAVPSVLTLFVSANLARVSGLAALADLRVVTALNQFVVFIPGAFATTFVTQFASSRGESTEISSHDFMRYTRLIVASASTTAAATAWGATWLVPALFGAHYAGSVKLVSLGVAMATLSTTKQALVVGLMSERKTGYALVDSLLSSLGYTFFAVLLTQKLGIVGLLLAEGLGQLLSLVVLAWLMAGRFRQGEVRAQAVRTVAAVTLTLALLGVGFLTYEAPYALALRTLGLAGLVVTLVTMLLTRQERAWAVVALATGWRRLRG